MKRLLALLLALFLLFSFASCNGDGEGAGGEGENNGGASEENGGSVIEKKDPVVTDVGTAKDVYTFQKSVHSKDGYARPYRMYVPDDYSEECAYPLVVFLHGAGERGDGGEHHPARARAEAVVEAGEVGADEREPARGRHAECGKGERRRKAQDCHHSSQASLLSMSSMPTMPMSFPFSTTGSE